MKRLFKIIKYIFISFIVLILVVIIPVGLTKLFEKIRAPFLSEQQKKLEDLDRLEYVFRNEFPQHTYRSGSEEFEKHLEKLKSDLQKNPSLSDQDFNLTVLKLVASFKDPHTAIANKSDFLRERFPVSITWNDGNFYLTGGLVKPKWLGAEIIDFEGIPGIEVFNRLRKYTNAPNQAGEAYFMKSIINSADILFAEDVIKKGNEIRLRVAINGDTTSLNFKSYDITANPPPGYLQMKDKFPKTTPLLYVQETDKNYWHRWFKEDSTFYIRYALCIDQGDLQPFWDEVLRGIDSLRPLRTIIDVRGNPGGDTQNHIRFLNSLQNNKVSNNYGKLFTLIDRGTGSAAIKFAADTERLTEAILVGEMTMDKPNTTSDPTYFTLTHSGIKMVVPSLFSLHTHLHDKRPALEPQITINQDYMNEGYFKDRVLDSINKITLAASSDRYADLPDSFRGKYNFSPLRHLNLVKKDKIWWLTIDGLLSTPLYQNDSIIYSRKYQIELIPEDSKGENIKLTIHNSDLILRKLPPSANSLELALQNNEFKKSEDIINNLILQEELSYFLDRPFFQSRIYQILNEKGFDQALALNQFSKSYFRDDPVMNIIDYQLYSQNDQSFRKYGSLIPLAGNLLKRYYSVMTTDKIMNDQYNAFIGR
ncbi:S41 family peptidase [Robertkochia aurantiaca]|uniref:S41 family peptidase n=1 Tax=Robertkochia aurantiaca TaxID=2873700 RepID=UPI001CCC9503|nr:S41 family peptidase [Robertkochia sp. 3YJGBD-33]